MRIGGFDKTSTISRSLECLENGRILLVLPYSEDLPTSKKPENLPHMGLSDKTPSPKDPFFQCRMKSTRSNAWLNRCNDIAPMLRLQVVLHANLHTNMQPTHNKHLGSQFAADRDGSCIALSALTFPQKRRTRDFGFIFLFRSDRPCCKCSIAGTLHAAWPSSP